MQKSPLLPLRTLHTNNFSIQLEKPETIQQLASIAMPSIVNQKYIKKREKQFSISVFVFQIRHQERQWKIRKRLQEFYPFQNIMKKRYGRQIATVPIRKQMEIQKSNVNVLAEFLLIYLRKIVNIAFYDDDVQNFLQILPAQKGNSIIYAQVPLKKRSGGRYNQAEFRKKVIRYLCCCCRNWRTRYFTVTDQGVFYTVKKKTFEIKQMIPFSSHFNILAGKEQTGEQFGIQIQSAYRTIELTAENLYNLVIFVHAAKEAFNGSAYKDKQRFQSFAGIKNNCQAKYYIDGEYYFEDLCNQLLQAKKQVYITDWMLTPYILLKRPRELDDRSSRLDYVLQGIASRGVKVYIILYMQPKIALNNDSEFVQKYLEQLHPNIKVLRHPNFLLIPFLWSHHEKIVVIDQKTAFLGGFDICYGRWDTQKHSLTQKNDEAYWKGAQFCNLRISDIYTPRNFLMSNLDPKIEPRMPWHDIGIRIRGASVFDVDRHFIEYWNFVSFQTRFGDRQLLMHAGRHSIKPRPQLQNLTGLFRRGIVENTSKSMIEETTPDEVQFYSKFLNTSITSGIMSAFQMPNLGNIKKYPRKLMNFLKEGEIPNQDDEQLMITQEIYQKVGTQTHQILRSASTWSLGLQERCQEKSIYNAYLSLILGAKEYIYLENQFFISKENRIVQFLAERINRAYENKQKFKLMIIMPLLPAFQGEVDKQSSAVLRAQLHWEYYSICRSKYSLYSRLSHIQHIQDYLQFHGLRTHGITEGKLPLTEIVYVHSKLMIVDDNQVIIGSANINDRSLLGDRDSQIAILVQNGQKVQIDGKLVSKFAHNLRVDLYMQHFGLEKGQAQNYLNDITWKKIRNRSQINTQIYREIFGCYPDDTIIKFSDIEKVKKQANIKKYQELSSHIKGYAVDFPLQFLMKQNLNLTPSQKEYFMPQINFT